MMKDPILNVFLITLIMLMVTYLEKAQVMLINISTNTRKELEMQNFFCLVWKAMLIRNRL